MTIEQAKQVLLLHRPGDGEAPDPELAEALQVAREDAGLRAWYDEHCAFQTAMRRKFREIEAPADLKDRIVAAQKIFRPTFRHHRALWLAAAAVVVLLFVLAGTFLQREKPDRFIDYRSRMVRTVLREYRMDIVTNEMAAVRRFMSSRGAPADYAVTAGLKKLSLTGGGQLKWRGNPVAMVCFDRGDKEMIFLFVMNKSALKDSPPAASQAEKVNKLLTVSWTEDDKTYVLAGPEEADFVKKYF
jgi:hypothetical protein